MGKITELTVTKGRTLKAGDREGWLRLEYSIKAFIDDENEIQTAKANIEGLIDGWLSSSILASSPMSAAKSLEAVQNAFPPELKELVSFQQNGHYIVIKPRQYLGAENFAKIAEIVKAQGGEYLSAGKESHFRIPKHAKRA
jgi:hypothetical protein